MFYKKIFSFIETILSFFDFLPESWATFLNLKFIKYAIWYEQKWLTFYVNQLLESDNYYQTLSHLNNNQWCPEELTKNFINYVNSYHSEMIHA